MKLKRFYEYWCLIFSIRVPHVSFTIRIARTLETELKNVSIILKTSHVLLRIIASFIIHYQIISIYYTRMQSIFLNIETLSLNDEIYIKNWCSFFEDSKKWDNWRFSYYQLDGMVKGNVWTNSITLDRI